MVVMMMHHHMVVHHVMMAHHMVVHHREGQGDDSGGEGLDQVKLHNVSDPDLHRIRNKA
jgi:hypothetical protein